LTKLPNRLFIERARLESGRLTPQPALNPKTMLRFNEGKVCEAIVRRLEERQQSARHGLRSPEDEGHPHPVEAAFMIGDRLFALEHTGIEPFGGHVRMEAEADRHFKPITDGLNGVLGTSAIYELHLPANAFEGRPMPEIRRLQQAIIAWVIATAPSVPARRYADYRGTSVGPVTPPGVPFALSLYRFEPSVLPGHYFQIKHVVTDIDKLRTERIGEAIARKFPKLAAWKSNHGARLVLVLEDNDIFLTNEIIVTDTYLPLAMARADRPDETYLVSTVSNPWHGWPILIDGKSLFDLAKNGDEPRWEIDPAGLTPLTKR
jgi:hypothetical protein